MLLERRMVSGLHRSDQRYIARQCATRRRESERVGQFIGAGVPRQWLPPVYYRYDVRWGDQKDLLPFHIGKLYHLLFH